MSRGDKVEQPLEPRIKKELDRIQGIIDTRYVTRAALMEDIRFPDNTPNLIVIKSNEKGIGFLKTCYDGRYCAGVIGKDEFDGIIEKASNMIGNVYSKKRQMDSQGVSIYYKLGLLLAVAISFAFLVMAYYLPEYALWYQILTFALLAVALVIVSAISLLNFCKRTDFIETFEEMVGKKLNDYFEKLNNMEYRSRGLEWYLVPGHYWLELRINNPRAGNIQATEGNNVYTTNMDTNENRLNTHNSKAARGREELKED